MQNLFGEEEVEIEGEVEVEGEEEIEKEGYKQWEGLRKGVGFNNYFEAVKTTEIFEYPSKLNLRL